MMDTNELCGLINTSTSAQSVKKYALDELLKNFMKNKGSEAGRKLVQKLMDKSLVIEIGKLLALPDTEISEDLLLSAMTMLNNLLVPISNEQFKDIMVMFKIEDVISHVSCNSEKVQEQTLWVLDNLVQGSGSSFRGQMLTGDVLGQISKLVVRSDGVQLSSPVALRAALLLEHLTDRNGMSAFSPHDITVLVPTLDVLLSADDRPDVLIHANYALINALENRLATVNQVLGLIGFLPRLVARAIAHDPLSLSALNNLCAAASVEQLDVIIKDFDHLLPTLRDVMNTKGKWTNVALACECAGHICAGSVMVLQQAAQHSIFTVLVRLGKSAPPTQVQVRQFALDGLVNAIHGCDSDLLLNALVPAKAIDLVLSVAPKAEDVSTIRELLSCLAVIPEKFDKVADFEIVAEAIAKVGGWYHMEDLRKHADSTVRDLAKKFDRDAMTREVEGYEAADEHDTKRLRIEEEEEVRSEGN